ncbi:Glycine betaine methyltransferase [anaerobic digester metagenome]
MMAALAGANVIYGMGMLEMGVTFSYAQLMLDDAIAKMVQRVVSGVDVNDELLAVDVIKEVGGGQGKQFLTCQHTVDFMRKEQVTGGLFDRSVRQTWMANTGGKDAAERANDAAKEILKNHKPEPLEKAVQKEIRRLVESAE